MLLNQECCECGSKYSIEFDLVDGDIKPYYCPFCGDEYEYSDIDEEFEFKSNLEKELDFD